MSVLETQTGSTIIGGQPAAGATAPKALLERARQEQRRRLIQVGLAFLTAAGALLWVWQSMTGELNDGGLAPTPSATWKRLLEVLTTAFMVDGPNNVGIFWHLIASLQRVLIGFGLAAAVAVPLGFLLGRSRVLSAALDPFIQILRPVSPLAWLPLGLAVMRNSESTALFVIFISALWPVLINTIDGVRRVNPLYLSLAQTLEATPFTTTFRILLPVTLPAIVTGLRTSLSTAWLVIIAAEMIVGGRGMGYFVWNEWNSLNTPSIVVAILIIGLIGFALDRCVAALQNLVPKA